jgi:hypothetical protein
MTVRITDEQFTDALKAVVQERGKDFKYPRGTEGWSEKYGNGTYNTNCLYVRTDVEEPACLIGAALHKAGVSLEELRAQEGQSAWAFVETYGISGDKANAAQSAQYVQDDGKTWGEALETFLNYKPLSV